MIIKAAVARSPQGPLSIETLDLDEPRADEILVRLVASGVASSDLAAMEGGWPIPFPFVAGSEGAGIVERIGAAVDGLTPGDTVLLTAASCGQCPNCLRGEPALCLETKALNRSGVRRDGSAPLFNGDLPVHGFFGGQSSFATHVLCRPRSAIKAPVETPLEVLACLGGETWTAASAVIHGLAPATDDTLVIAGAGPLGLVAVMTARAMGLTSIIVVDPDAKAREAASDLGASLTVHSDEDLAAVVMSLTGVGARFALETTGRRAGLRACLAALRPRGVCGLLRPLADHDAKDADAGPHDVTDLSRGVGSPHEVVATLLAWHADGRFPIDRLVAFFPFEHINDAIDALASHKVAKPVVRFSIGPFAATDRAGAEGAAVEAPETGQDGLDELEAMRGDAALVTPSA